MTSPFDPTRKLRNSTLVFIGTALAATIYIFAMINVNRNLHDYVGPWRNALYGVEFYSSISMIIAAAAIPFSFLRLIEDASRCDTASREVHHVSCRNAMWISGFVLIALFLATNGYGWVNAGANDYELLKAAHAIAMVGASLMTGVYALAAYMPTMADKVDGDPRQTEAEVAWLPDAHYRQRAFRSYIRGVWWFNIRISLATLISCSVAWAIIQRNIWPPEVSNPDHVELGYLVVTWTSSLPLCLAACVHLVVLWSNRNPTELKLTSQSAAGLRRDLIKAYDVQQARFNPALQELVFWTVFVPNGRSYDMHYRVLPANPELAAEAVAFVSAWVPHISEHEQRDAMLKLVRR